MDGLFQTTRRRLHQRQFRQFAVFITLIIGLSTSIVYANVQTFDPIEARSTGYSDSIDYINMYRGEPGTGIRAYRPLVPFLASLVPDPPRAIFHARRQAADTSEASEARTIALKFGLVNLVFLIGTCIAFYILMRDFGYHKLPASLGVLIFLSSQTVVRSAGLPMVDTAFYFFLVVCLIGLIRDQFWIVLIAGLMGVIAKELLLVAAPLALLTSHPWRSRLRLVAGLLPAFALYGIIRMTSNAPADTYSMGDVIQIKAQLPVLFSVNGAFNLFMAFGLIWIPACYGLVAGRVPPVARRWLCLVPLVLLGVLFGGGNLGRGTFSAFPVVIPVAVSGLTRWLVSAKRTSALPQI